MASRKIIAVTDHFAKIGSKSIKYGEEYKVGLAMLQMWVNHATGRQTAGAEIIQGRFEVLALKILARTKQYGPYPLSRKNLRITGAGISRDGKISIATEIMYVERLKSSASIVRGLYTFRFQSNKLVTREIYTTQLNGSVWKVEQLDKMIADFENA